MYLFIRSVRAQNAASVSPAIRFASGICDYVNKTYNVKMRFGVEVLGHTQIHWLLYFDSVDTALAMNQKMMTDPEYETLLDKGSTLWVSGSMKDRLIRMIA